MSTVRPAREPAVLLISPGIVRWMDMDFGLPHLVAVGGWLRQRLGVRVEIIDLNYEGGDHHSLLRTLDELGPFLCVGISAYTSFDLLRVHALADMLKKRWPAVPLVAGGYHASALPEDLVFPGSPFDAVVLGEGEVPFEELVTQLLGGGPLEKALWGPGRVDDLDTLPPYAWDLLDRYWPRATEVGRKLQIYLSRGCPYHCTFCMERSKSGYSWRSFSPERAVDELKRLAARTQLDRWVVNIADPLFGFQRRWRQEVLQGILDAGLRPRQFWTLTRTDDLDEVDVDLLARARFSIGIGMESGSPEMLRLMQKGNQPDRYLDNLRRLARLSKQHGLNWAANVIVGHPGETPETMRQTHAFVRELFLSASESCGWVSIDPFRLYPGSDVHQQAESWSARTGAVFHHPKWWWSWYDGPFRAQHIEPSSSLSYEDRVRFMYDAYGQLVGEVQARFRGQGRSVDRVFERSLAEQRDLLSPRRRDEMILRGRAALASPPIVAPRLALPIGWKVRDPWVRLRETAVRRLLDEGVLRTSSVVEALLEVAPERFLGEADAKVVLADRTPEVPEGRLPGALRLRAVAQGLEALGVAPGDHVADLTARRGWMAALLAHMVGAEGQVDAVHVDGAEGQLRADLAGLPQVQVLVRSRSRQHELPEPVDRLWIGAALPRRPKHLVRALAEADGRMVTWIGPRFGLQDMVVLTRNGEGLDERVIARMSVPVLGGRHGWLDLPEAPGSVTVESRAGPALAFGILAGVDLGRDAASSFDARVGPQPWSAEIAAAWRAAPGRLGLLVLMLSSGTVSQLLASLEGPPKGLQDPAGQALCAAMRRAVVAERAGFDEGWRDIAGLRKERVRSAQRHADTLAGWRRQLWVVKGAPPPMVLLDVPALGGRARAVTVDGLRIVGTDLGRPPSGWLMQVLHEEVHPITDPVVRAEHSGEERGTRPGEPGWGLHQELERTAVLATEAFLRARDPSWMPAFDAWMSGGRG